MSALQNVSKQVLRVSSNCLKNQVRFGHPDLIARPRNHVPKWEQVGLGLMITFGILAWPVYAIYNIPYWGGSKKRGGQAEEE